MPILLLVSSSRALLILFRTFQTDALKNEIEFAGAEFMRHLSVVWGDFLDVEGSFQDTLTERDVRTVPVHSP